MIWGEEWLKTHPEKVNRLQDLLERVVLYKYDMCYINRHEIE